MKAYVKLFEDFINEKKPSGAPEWKDSDAPDAEGRFRDLGIKDLASWLIKTRKGDLKKISGSLTQQVVFNRKEDPAYAEKMEKVRKEVYKQLNREDLIESVKDGVITCDSCGWHWDIVQGGDDPYDCHKCGHNNQPLVEKKSPYTEETLKKYKSQYEKGEKIPFGVKSSLIAQGMIPHEGGEDKGKKKKTELYEQFDADNLNINQIDYGHSPIEFVELMNKTDDPIKNWFTEAGLIEKIKNEAPLNDSAITKNDLQVLLEKTSKATAEEITFARYVDDVSNLAQTFIDLLKENGHDESMGGFFSVDHQTECLLFFLKDAINRPRPYQLAKSFGLPMFPLMRTDAMTAAYPNGHALTAFVMSEYYARKYPAISGKLLALGEKIANSREITGIHFPSDTQISKEICKIIYDNNLLSNETY